ncbi:glycosyl transferase family 39 [Limnospira fusiformis CCALA 023]|uniref:glycosyltransferase family 39 protein n=1 Tax=Arthrospira sp. PCC 8006 TaxID=1982224 RepID=UPI00396D7B1A
MLYQPKVFTGGSPRRLVILLMIVIVLGVFFRFASLDRKLYSHDEVFTNLRSAGFTREQVDQQLFSDRIFTPSELLEYQRLKPDSTAADTLASLHRNPHHPPLYYLIARGWMRGFGSSILASRLLPAVISLISLPLIYALAWELFQSPLISLMATALLAVSPVDVLLAQTARQYSLMTALIIASSLMLLKGSRTNNWLWWLGYVITCTLGLYTHLFFGLVIASHIGWGILIFGSEPRRNYKPRPSLFFIQLAISICLTVVLYLPWITVIIHNWEQAQDLTSWTHQSMSLLDLSKFWMLSFTSVLVDIDFGFNSFWTYLFRLPFLLLIIYALYYVSETNDSQTGLFILTAILIPFILLVLPDFLWGGQRSSVTRYLIACFPAIQMAIAFLLVTHLNTGRQSLLDGEKLWLWVLAILLSSSIISLGLSTVSSTWWDKGLSYFNHQVATEINQANSSVVISDAGNGTNTGDLISLSYLLDNNEVKLILMSNQPSLQLIPENSTIFVFRPSQELQELLQQNYGDLEQVLDIPDLWKVQ